MNSYSVIGQALMGNADSPFDALRRSDIRTSPIVKSKLLMIVFVLVLRCG